MLEKFTDEEIEQIKFELRQLEEKDKGKAKPGSTPNYKNTIKRIFKDRPYHYPSYEGNLDIADRCLGAVDTIVSFTMDCTKIKDQPSRYYHHDHALHTQRMSRVPGDIADEYYEMFDEVIELIKKHIKPYKRFLEEEEE